MKVDPVEVKEGEVRAFYIASTKRILVGHDSDAARPSDKNIVSSIGRCLVVEQFGYGLSGIKWRVWKHYLLLLFYSRSVSVDRLNGTRRSTLYFVFTIAGTAG